MDSANFLIQIEANMKGGGQTIDQLGKLEKNMKGASGVTNFFANTSLFSLRRAVDHLGGPLGGVLGHIFRFGEGLHKMAKKGGTLGLATGGALIAAGAVAELAAKFIEGAAAALKYAFATADAARNQGLTLQAMLGSKAAADDMSSAFGRIEKSTGASNDRLMKLTEDLEDAHLSGANMATAINAIATQEQAIGTSKTAALVAQLKGGAISANQLANTITTKYGGIVKEKMLGLSQQAEVFKENVAGIFGGLKIDGFLGALQKLIGLLDQNTASGKALKFLFETVFQPLVNAATRVMPYIELAILRFINTILRMYIAIKPTIRKVEDLFHIKTGDGIKIALRAGEIAAYALAGAVGLVLVAFGLLALPFAALGGAIYGVIYAVTHAKEIFGTVKGAVSKAFHGAVDAVWSAIKAIPGLVGDAITAAIAFFINIPDALGSAVAAAVNLFDAGINALPDVIDAVVSTISDAIAAVPGAFNDVVSAIGSAFAQIPTLLADGVDFVTGLPAKFAEAGDQIINGLVEAIKSGAAKVITAVENLGKDTVKAAKKIFHISSPSREFYEIGTMNTEGLALGHEDGADRVKGSIDAIGDLPESSPIRRGGGAKNVIHAVFHITGGNAKENAQEIKRVLEDLFETHAIEVSGGTEATA